MESAIFRLKSSLEGVNQNNPLIFLPRIKSLRRFVIFPKNSAKICRIAKNERFTSVSPQ